MTQKLLQISFVFKSMPFKKYIQVRVIICLGQFQFAQVQTLIKNTLLLSKVWINCMISITFLTLGTPNETLNILQNLVLKDSLPWEFWGGPSG